MYPFVQTTVQPTTAANTVAQKTRSSHSDRSDFKRTLLDFSNTATKGKATRRTASCVERCQDTSQRTGNPLMSLTFNFQKGT